MAFVGLIFPIRIRNESSTRKRFVGSHMKALTLLVVTLIPITLLAQASSEYALDLDSWRARLKSTTWVELWADDRMLIAFDSARVKTVAANKYQFWLNWMSASLKSYDEYGTKKYDSHISKWQVDCSEMSYRSAEAIFYRERDVVASEPAKWSEWTEPIPSTYADAVVTAACGDDSVVKLFAPTLPKAKKKK